MDFVIVKVNGQDLSNATHEETVNSLNTAQEPITVEVLRRATATTATTDNRSAHTTTIQTAMSSVSTQTEDSSLDTNCCNRIFIVPAPPPLNSCVEEIASLAECTDQLDISGETEEEQGYGVEYDQIILKRASVDDRIGLTLCYGEIDEVGVSDVFIGDVEPESIAGKSGRIQAGDQIIKINNKDVRSRDEAIKLFSENRADINLLICRPANLLDQMDDGFLEDCGNSFEEHYYDSLLSTQDIKMMPLIEVEETSEFEDESTLTDTATLPSRKEKEAKDSGVGQDSAGSSEQECDSSHYDTINPADDVELTSEIIEDRSEFRQLLESRCVDLSPDLRDQLSKAQQCDNNNRVFPRMGTKIIQYGGSDSSPVKATCTDTYTDTAYNTAESCPTTLELTKNIGGSSLSLSDNRKQKKRSQEKKKSRRSAAISQSASPSQSDITYTTEDKLAETIAYQQQVLLEQSKNSTLTRENTKSQNTDNLSESSNMEWVVKRKADGTRYVTRRPIRTKILSERKKKLETERCGMTTDDDAVSEFKTGRHWSKDERRRHLQKSREHQERKVVMQQRIEMYKKAAKEGQTNILELSHKKLQKHAMKDLDFATVQELLAHQGQIPISSSNLISVTTV